MVDFDNMEFNIDSFREACSICFTSNCEFSLPDCQDQFCRPCLKRYFTDVISQSWGLETVEIKCPVCYDVLPKETWSNYVEGETVELYDRYNSASRVLSRFCAHPKCGAEVPIVPHLMEDEKSRNKMVRKIGRLLRDSVKPESHALEEFPTQSKLLAEGLIEVDVFYQFFLETCEDNEFTPELRQDISAKMIAVNPDVGQRRQLEYLHLRHFPFSKCGECQSSVCFHCGELAHPGLTCVESIERRTAACQVDNPRLLTLAWKFDNSKQCPRCSIFMERDAGCFQMTCPYCTFKYCWNCMSKWSSTCGYYLCQTGDAIKVEDQADGAEADAGVPDVLDDAFGGYLARQAELAAANAAAGEGGSGTEPSGADAFAGFSFAPSAAATGGSASGASGSGGDLLADNVDGANDGGASIGMASLLFGEEEPPVSDDDGDDGDGGVGIANLFGNDGTDDNDDDGGDGSGLDLGGLFD